MAGVADERLGLLIIRAWVEAGSASPLRAQLRWTTNVSRGLENGVTLIDVESVQSAVGEWLRDVLAAGDDAEGPAAQPQ